MRRVKEELSPETALEALHELFFLGRQFEALERIEGIHLLDRDDRGPGVATLRSRLFHVEVQVVAVLRNGRETGVDGFLEQVLVVPDQHQVVARELVAVDDVFPAFERLTVFGQDLLHPPGKIAQQLLFIGITELLHQLLAVGAVLPGFRNDLFYTHMEVFGGEDGGQLLDDVFEHHVVLLAAHADDVVRLALHAAEFLVVLAHHFGIGNGQGFGVARKVEFGNDLDVAFGGISHDLLEILLGIKAAIALFPRIVSRHQGLVGAAPGADLCQAGILLDLDPPAVVVGQVPVELVDLVIGQEIEVAQDVFLVEEGAGNVEHAAAPGEAGLVDNAHARKRALADQHGVRTRGAAIYLGRKHLQQGLDGIELASLVGSCDDDGFRMHVEGIAFRREAFHADERDARLALRRVPAVAHRIEHAGQMFLQILDIEGITAFDAYVFVENE